MSLLNIPQAEWFDDAIKLADEQIKDQANIEYTEKYSKSVLNKIKQVIYECSLPEGMKDKDKFYDIKVEDLAKQLASGTTPNFDVTSIDDVDGNLIDIENKYDLTTIHEGQQKVHAWYIKAMQVAENHRNQFVNFCKDNQAFDEMPQRIYDKTKEIMTEEYVRLMDGFEQCKTCGSYQPADEMAFGGQCVNCSGIADFF